MNKDKLDALLMKIDGDSAYAEAVAEEALEGIRELLEQVEALRARAVPEVVWPEGRIYVDMGELRLVARPDGEWWVEITTENDTEEVVSGHETSLELAQSACRAAFLRLVGVAS